MKNIISVVAGLALIVAAGLVHGAWTNRWGVRPSVAALAERLRTLPATLGGWTSEDRTIPPRELAMTGAVGHVNRVYSSSDQGLVVSILLLTGLPGDIATHTPEACYPGAGYTLGETTQYTFRYGDPERGAEFRTAIASRGGANPSTLRIYWAWRGSESWSAPDDPRWTFATMPALTKLYIVRETGGAKSDPQSDPCNQFMQLILPELDRLIREPGHAGETAPPSVKQ